MAEIETRNPAEETEVVPKSELAVLRFKARGYDLMVANQQIIAELNQTQQRISELSQS